MQTQTEKPLLREYVAVLRIMVTAKDTDDAEQKVKTKLHGPFEDLTWWIEDIYTSF